MAKGKKSDDVALPPVDSEEGRDRQGRQWTARHLAAVHVLRAADVPDSEIEKRLDVGAGKLGEQFAAWERSYEASTARIGDGEKQRAAGGWKSECRHVAEKFGFDWDDELSPTLEQLDKYEGEGEGSDGTSDK